MQLTTLKGGGRNTVPTPGVDLPDVKNATDLKNLMRFYNILGHGVMSEEKHRVFLIPNNTWTLFITRAGIPADKRKSGELRTVLDDFYFLRENESIKEWYDRIYKSMVDGTLFKAILYSKSGDKIREHFSIYEPGDLVQDLELQFINDSWPFMRLGIWELPIPHDVKEYLNTINNTKSIINHRPTIQAILQNIQNYITEKPSLQEGIIEILRFLLDMSNITYENYIKFERNPQVIKALNDPTISKYYNEFHREVQSTITQNRELQHRFFTDERNLLQYSPSAKRNNLNSNLYSILSEKRLNIVRPTETTNEDLLATPKYKFILVDACRSIESPSTDELLYRPRMALTRSMSIAARTDICTPNLLEMTRRKFEELVEGKNLGESSVIRKLLAGEAVLLTEFESGLLAEKGSLRTFLEEQQYPINTPVYFRTANAKEHEGTVAGINLDKNGKLLYTVITPNNNDPISVPVSSVYKNKNHEGGIGLMRFIENSQIKRLKQQIETAKEKEIKTEVNAAYKNMVAEKQKSEWEKRFFRRVDAIYGTSDKRSLTLYIKGQDVRTLVPKDGINTNESVRIESYGTNANGNLGYNISYGAKKDFYTLEEVISLPEKLDYDTLMYKIEQSTLRFPRGTQVRIKGMTGAKYLNDKIGVIVNIGKHSTGDIIYKVKVYFAKEKTNGTKENAAIQVISIKPINLEKVVDPIENVFPKNTNAPPSLIESLQLNQAIVNALRKDVNTRVRSKRAPTTEGGRRKTRRSRKSKKQRKTRRN